MDKVKTEGMVLWLPAEGPPQLLPKPKELKAWQKLVGGYIELTSSFGFEAVVNENGLFCGLPRNRHLPLYVGDVVLCRGGMRALTSKDFKILKELKLLPEDKDKA